MSFLYTPDVDLEVEKSTPQESTSLELTSLKKVLQVVDDPYSDRLRCDHPPLEVDGGRLGESLVQVAEECGRSRVVALVHREMARGLETQGFAIEGIIPGFYEGEADCAVAGYGLDEERMELANPREVARADAVLKRPFELVDLDDLTEVRTERAQFEDAPAIAELMDATFTDYPTPSSEPAYIVEQLAQGTPFRVIRDGQKIVACASADLIPTARTAELTDCATRPTHRGRGYMQGILRDLMFDLAGMDYPTAFTLARARIPGINRAFQKLGFRYRGRMNQSCRIGEGFEDMNIWSRSLPG